MLNGLSDSNLGTFSSWLHFIGFIGLVCVTVSLAGGYLVNSQMTARANQKVQEETHLAQVVQTEVVIAETRKADAEHKLAEALAVNAPRQVTEAQRHDFIAALKDAPKGRVEVYIYDYRDQEVQGYATQIRNLLVLAGYDCGEKVQVSNKPYSPEGILVVAKDPRSAPEHAGAIQHAFGEIGIDAPAARDENLDLDQVIVVVGRKFE